MNALKLVFAIFLFFQTLGITAQNDYKSLFENAEAVKYQDPDAALSYLWQIPNHTRSDEAAYSRLLRMLSTVHYIAGHFDSAAYYYGIRLERAIETSDEKEIANAYNGLGLIYNTQDQHEAAAQSHAKGYEMAVRLEDSVLMAKHLINASIALYDRTFDKQLDSAKQLLNRAIALLIVMDEKQLLAMSYNHRGIIKTMKNDWSAAIEDHDQALKLAAKENLWEQSFGLAGKSEALLSAGRLKESILAGEQALEKALELDALWEIHRIARILSTAYEQTGDYQNALSYHQMFKVYGDSLFNREKQKEKNAALLKLSKFENQALAQERELAVLREKKTRVTVYYLVALILLITVILIVLYYHFQQKNKLSRELRKKNEIIATHHVSLSEMDKKKNQILSVISHDMRAPIGTITGMVHVIKKEFKLTPQLSRVVKELEQQIDHLSLTLSDLLHWSRTQFAGVKVEKRKVQISKVVGEVLELHSQTIDSKKLQMKHSPGDGCAFAEYQQVKIVLRNLISNAMKFSPEGGQIVIDQQQLGNKISITITDQGVGMNSSEVEDLLSGRKDSTFGTKNEPGTGFGFSMCLQYAAENDGSISVVSSVGEGTTVTLTLPACN